MQSFFVDSNAKIAEIIDAVANTTETATNTSCKQGTGLNKRMNGPITACFDSPADDLLLLHGRNGPATGATIKTAAGVSQTCSSPTILSAERALGNLRDAAQQLGIRHLAAAAADAVTKLSQPMNRGKPGVLLTSGTAARLHWELLRAEAAWWAADRSSTARVVVTAVSTIVPAGGAFRPMSGALRFSRVSDRARPAGLSAGP
jgi:hypothetical protein